MSVVYMQKCVNDFFYRINEMDKALSRFSGGINEKRSRVLADLEEFMNKCETINRKYHVTDDEHRIKDAEFDRIPTNLLKCPYRLVRLTKLHPITGSPNGIEGFATEYELLKDEKPISFNNKKYPYIFDYDPGSIIVNALPGELVRAKLFYNDKGCVYTEYKIREVLRSKTRLGQFDNSGLDNFDY